MASIRKHLTLNAPADFTWDAVRDFGAVGRRLARGFVVGSVMDGDARQLRFSNGATAHELLVTCDGAGRRLVYTARSERLVHHNGSMQIAPGAQPNTTDVTWVIDILPNELEGYIAGMMEDGLNAMKATVQADYAAALSLPRA